MIATTRLSLRQRMLASGVLLLAAASLTPAADVGSATDAAPTVDLTWQEARYAPVNAYLPAPSEKVPFLKEPAVSRSGVWRGRLHLGGQDTNAVRFIWDRSAGKLFLDLNRNGDLTDDPNGVFTTGRGDRGNYQSFANVRVPLKTPSGERRLAGDLSLWDYGSQLSGSFALRSFWQGKAVLHGEECEIGVLDSDLGRAGSLEASRLLIRAWSERDKPFTTFDGSLQTVAWSKKLFHNGHAYQLSATSSDSGTLRLQFTEEHPALGEARVAGQFVRRLVLEDGPYQVVVDRPSASLRVPVGSYSQPQACLQSGEVAAYLQMPTPRPPQRSLTVSEKEPVTLNVGGPLTNTVSATRRGSALYLSYSLTGAGGRAYARVVQDRTKPPQFVVSQGGKKVGSGKFEFG